ncbi:MAG: GNAT family N-acetyltransferase [Pseudomonadota bacterium]
MLSVVTITPDDDLDQITEQINSAQWDEANALEIYTPSALAKYLASEGAVFVACYDISANTRTFCGMASARILLKPYEHETWLYVDEVDVCVDQRQKGAGRALMRALIEISEANDCEELWLGTEVDNFPANALYQSLDPDDVAQVVGYTFCSEKD